MLPLAIVTHISSDDTDLQDETRSPACLGPMNRFPGNTPLFWTCRILTTHDLRQTRYGKVEQLVHRGCQLVRAD